MAVSFGVSCVYLLTAWPEGALSLSRKCLLSWLERVPDWHCQHSEGHLGGVRALSSPCCSLWMAPAQPLKSLPVSLHAAHLIGGGALA